MIPSLTLPFHSMMEELPQTKFAVIDTETNGLDVRSGVGYLTGLSITICVSDSLSVFASGYYPFRHVADNLDLPDRELLKKTIENYSGWLIFHNAKFDLVSLSTLGVNYTGKFYCTMLMAHLINENLLAGYSLNSCVHNWVSPDESKKDDPLFKSALKVYGWGGMPVELMKAYAIYDAVLTMVLYIKLKPIFDKEVTAEYWEHKQKFVRTIIKMESRGVRIYTELCEKMITIGEEVMNDISATVKGNIGSPIFLQKLLIDELKLPVVKRSTKTGKPSFDKFAMEIYDQMLEHLDDPTAEYVRTYRGWQKSVSSNYRPYLDLLSGDGRLRPNYKLHGTKTGRCSCEKPNLQQIPRVSDRAWNGDLKGAFIPEEGYGLWEADYSQLEFRLGTAYAKEQSLIKIFADPTRDVFSEMAAELNMERFATKTLVYTVQYGGGGNRIANVFGVSVARGVEIKENFYHQYPGFKKMTNMAASVCKTKGQIKIWSGRNRHFWSRTNDSHKAFNSVVQGGAADIVEYKMNELMDKVDNNECRMLLTVHDSVIWEIKNGLVDKYRPLIIEIMENIEQDFGVVFAVQFKRWGE